MYYVPGVPSVTASAYKNSLVAKYHTGPKSIIKTPEGRVFYSWGLGTPVREMNWDYGSTVFAPPGVSLPLGNGVHSIDTQNYPWSTTYPKRQNAYTTGFYNYSPRTFYP